MREWAPAEEVKLFRAICHYKPAGIAKNFHLISILEALNSDSTDTITVEDINEKLASFYDLQGLDDIENDEEGDESGSEDEKVEKEDPVKDFELPWSEFSELILRKARRESESPESFAEDTEEGEDGESEEVEGQGEEPTESEEAEESEEDEEEAEEEAVEEYTEVEKPLPKKRGRKPKSEAQKPAELEVQKKRKATDQLSSSPAKSRRLRAARADAEDAKDAKKPTRKQSITKKEGVRTRSAAPVPAKRGRKKKPTK